MEHADAEAPHRHPRPGPAPLKIVGEEVIVLASGAQTGSYEIFRQAGPEGSGPPPHRHAWDEAFYVLDGEVDVRRRRRTETWSPRPARSCTSPVARRTGSGSARAVA